jgi:hypothetical protein
MMLERYVQTERGRETEDVLHDKKIQAADKWTNVLHPVHDTPEETQLLNDSCRLFHCSFQCGYPCVKMSVLKTYRIVAGSKSSGILSLGTIQLHVPVALPAGKETTVFHCIWRWMEYVVAQLVEALCYKPEGRGFDSVTGGFHWHNPSCCSMAMWLTKPLTEMSTKNNSWGVKAAGA